MLLLFSLGLLVSSFYFGFVSKERGSKARHRAAFFILLVFLLPFITMNLWQQRRVVHLIEEAIGIYPQAKKSSASFQEDKIILIQSSSDSQEKILAFFEVEAAQRGWLKVEQKENYLRLEKDNKQLDLVVSENFEGKHKHKILYMME